MALILAVDDEPEALGTIRRVLRRAEHTVLTVDSGAEALRVLKEEQPDLVILDVLMPEMSGLEVCRRVRADPFHAKLPILFLTARSRPSDITEGLDAGGDDYVTKPFQVDELQARVRALLRRAGGGALDRDAVNLTVGSLSLSLSRPDIAVAGRRHELTALEHRLVHYLMVYAGQPCTIDQLLEHVWEYPPGTGDPALVYAQIKNLRRKIEPDPDSPVYIRTVHGRGYLISG
ncbi:MAG: response regulator transcription factor [Chloroflexota bacterium]|nr:response regulator transcription factor [Chloroflexota bacterium]